MQGIDHLNQCALRHSPFQSLDQMLKLHRQVDVCVADCSLKSEWLSIIQWMANAVFGADRFPASLWDW